MGADCKWECFGDGKNVLKSEGSCDCTQYFVYTVHSIAHNVQHVSLKPFKSYSESQEYTFNGPLPLELDDSLLGPNQGLHTARETLSQAIGELRITIIK